MGITHVVPDKVRDLWNEEDIRVLVLLSLLLQTLLIFLAPLRKRTASKLLTFALWSFYLGADYVAILALGNILSGQTASDDSSQPNSDAQLMAFWAPFLLLHLGGPDTITSFSQEDNDLWLRHFLGLVVQISVTFLVLLASSFSSRLLLAGSVLVFVAGFIKFAERTWALRLASKEKIEDTLDYLGVTGEHLFDKPEIVAIISQSSLPDSEPLTEPLLISTAHYFFAKFTRPRLLARYVRGDDDVINRCSPLFIQICNAVQAFCMVEVELSFFHDILYTKASFLRGLNGIAWRCLNLMLAIAALLIFQLSEKQGSKKSNLVITYTLVLGGIVLEMVSVLFLIFSDWTVSSLEERGFRRIAEAISKVTHCIFRKPKPRWSNTIAQYNLISVFLKTNKPSIMRRAMCLLNLQEAWDNFWYINHVRVPDKLKDMIVDTLRLYDMSIIGGLYTKDKLRSQLEFLKAQLPPYFVQELMHDNSKHNVLFWSISTQICYNITSVRDKNDEEMMMHRMIGHQLSKYMMNILAPEVKDNIEIFYKNLKSFFDGKEQPGSEADVCNKLIDDFQKDETEFEFVVTKALARAYEMNELEVGLRWRLISFIWVDILIMHAYRLQQEQIWKSQWVNNGGQLILNVWVLIGHFKNLNSRIEI